MNTLSIEDRGLQFKVIQALRLNHYQGTYSEDLFSEAILFLANLELSLEEIAALPVNELAEKLAYFDQPLPVELPLAIPAQSRRFVELCILARALALVVPSRFEESRVAELETLVRKRAAACNEPSCGYARRIALRYSIPFGGKLLDCFGYWEPDNKYCQQCKLESPCAERVRNASLGALTNPALSIFRIPPDLERPSQPLQILTLDRTTNEGALAAVTDRKTFLSWIRLEYPDLVQVDYDESVNFQLYHPHTKKKMILLKVNRFTVRAYSVLFGMATKDQADTLGLAQNRAGFTYSAVGLVNLQNAVREYLKVALDIPPLSVQLSPEEELKLKIQKKLVQTWTGRIEHRAGYDLFFDTKNRHILRFGPFTPKAYKITFSRWNKEEAKERGLKPTSNGARYEGHDEEELNRILQEYLSGVKSQYFSLKYEPTIC
jgi:hypothetical protein